MKRFNILTVILPMVFSFNFVSAQQNDLSPGYDLFGDDFKQVKVVEQSATVYGKIQERDTVNTQLTGEIKEVCQSKGCWMKVNLANDKEVFVKFKDYGFFVPSDAAGKKVVMNGKAFLEEVSVDEQRHYAKDKGATDSEIQKIRVPKRTLRFEADGVLIKK